MKKINVKSLVSHGRAALIVALLPVLVVAPFVASVWRNKQIRSLLQQKEVLNEEYLQLQSETAAFEISIEKLSTSERLESYALDSLGMVQPNPVEILGIERDSEGAIVVEEHGFGGFIDKLMGL